MDMSKESEKKKLLPEGWREFEILDCKEQVSKQGNDMFKFTFIDVETEQEEEVYAVATQGKRWFLKQVLIACGVAAGQDGIYEWDISNVLGKVVLGYVSHQEEEWINRENKTVKSMKSKITEVAEKGDVQEKPKPEDRPPF